MFKDASDYDQKLPAWNKGICKTEEHKRKLSLANKGKCHRTNYGHTEETKKMLSNKSKENWKNKTDEEKLRHAEHTRKIHKGRTVSAETREKMSMAMAKISYGKTANEWANELDTTVTTVNRHLAKGDFLEWKEKMKKNEKRCI